MSRGARAFELAYHAAAVALGVWGGCRIFELIAF